MVRKRTSWPKTALAFVAALAVLFQFGLAQVAMAKPDGQTMEICTSHGTQTIVVDAVPGDPAKAPCSHCEHCVMPALAADAATVALTVETVRYVTAHVRHSAAVAVSPYLATGPPRPFGQGPPQTLNL